MSIVLYRAGGAGDFNLDETAASDQLAQYKQNVSDLLRVRGHALASELFAQLPWILRNASNWFNDEFSVLHATVGLEQYERTRSISESPEHRLALRRIAETITEIGPYIRFIVVALDPNRRVEPSDPRSLKDREINKVVNKYIGVSGGYLGDFTYRSHQEFYNELELDIDPNKLSGTTRERFIQILSGAAPDVQARILQGVLDRYPVDSNPSRTTALYDEIAGWIRRLGTSSVVTIGSLRFTSAVVERALGDAEMLMARTGATSGVDRAHTALHGYLLQVCADEDFSIGQDPSLTQLFKVLRSQHPKFQNLGARSEDVGKLLGAMATVVDVLNPIRNKASVAHPNQNLLDEPEALLVINSVRTLLNYFDSKLNR